MAVSHLLSDWHQGHLMNHWIRNMHGGRCSHYLPPLTCPTPRIETSDLWAWPKFKRPLGRSCQKLFPEPKSPSEPLTVSLSNNPILCFLPRIGYWGEIPWRQHHQSPWFGPYQQIIPCGWIKMPLTPWGAWLTLASPQLLGQRPSRPSSPPPMTVS